MKQSEPLAFTTPKSIKQYGLLIEDFNRAMKAFAYLRGEIIDTDYVRSIVGEGPYNSLPDGEIRRSGVVRYGAESHAQGKDKSEGLFGAFGIVHLPEIILSSRAPNILGKEFGCTLAVTRDGKTFTAPLHEVRFGFNPRRSNTGGLEFVGEITLADNTLFTHSDGTSVTLDKGTVLTRGVHKGLRFSQLMVAHRFAREPEMRLLDKDGQAIDERIATTMLWSHLEVIHGLKRQEGTDGFRTMVQDAGDDDFQAEQFVIDWMNGLRRHDIDLVPYFAKAVDSARRGLQSRPDLLLSIAKAIAVSQEVEKDSGCAFMGDENNPASRYFRYSKAWDFLKSAQALAKTMRDLGVELPAYTLTDEDKKYVESLSKWVEHEVADTASSLCGSDLKSRFLDILMPLTECKKVMNSYIDAMGDNREKIDCFKNAVRENTRSILVPRLEGVFQGMIDKCAERERRVLTEKKAMWHDAADALSRIREYLLQTPLEARDLTPEYQPIHRLAEVLRQRGNTSKPENQLIKFAQIMESVGADGENLYYKLFRHDVLFDTPIHPKQPVRTEVAQGEQPKKISRKKMREPVAKPEQEAAPSIMIQVGPEMSRKALLESVSPLTLHGVV